MECSQRVTIAEVRDTCCNTSATNATDEQIATAIEVGLELFDLATGSTYPGICEVTIRPCPPRPCGCSCSPCGHEMARGRGPCCTSAPLCGCARREGVRLPHSPVVQVLEVSIDGTPLNPALWAIVAGDWIVRRDGAPWPVQDLLTPLGGPDTWSITYTFGRDIPAAAKRGLISMICEIAKGLCGMTCQLPQGVKILKIGEVAFPEFDNYRKDGLTGYQVLDDWIVASRGGHTRHRVRTSTFGTRRH